jgi:hypothetical protein
MGRLSTMTENGTQAASAAYNWADQITSLTYGLFYETRTYDPRMMQLTRILTTNWATA